MALPLTSKVFTYTLTNDSIAITSADTLKGLSVYNSSETAGTILGTAIVDGNASATISVGQNETYTINVPSEADILDTLTVTAPADCTLLITATK